MEFKCAPKWRKEARIEAKKFLLEETRSRGKDSRKIRKGRRATVFLETNALSWFQGFVDGAIQLVKCPGWKSTLKIEESLSGGTKKKLKGLVSDANGTNGRGQRQVICIPEGRDSSGWKVLEGLLQEYTSRLFATKESELKAEGESPKESTEVTRQKTEETKEDRPDQRIPLVCLTIVPRIAVSGGNEGWEKKMVVSLKNKVKDWTEILNAIAKTLGIKDLLLLKPFESNKAILETGSINLNICRVEISEGIAMIENWCPACNEKSAKEGSFILKILGILFNLRLEPIWEKILIACVRGLGRSYEHIVDLHAARIRIAGAKPEDIPHSIDLFIDGVWHKMWVATEAEVVI
uniref:Uncharacterized protein n=1 Tax=Nelumbo nucifera TaxID=4432 RepID=A0A822YCG1_NELNU|nr:TPA_asm: hypothetical protein HUJ06_031480 [Nelumbo nucifera]